jgi:MFS transporter, DHA2 family, methylenomycin A resistance protein
MINNHHQNILTVDFSHSILRRNVPIQKFYDHQEEYFMEKSSPSKWLTMLAACLGSLMLYIDLFFVMGSLSFFLFSAALLGSQPYWSLFMQNTWGYTPLQGGLAFLPTTVLVVLLTPLAGLLAQWAGPRLYLVLVLGLILVGASFLYVVITLTPQSGYVDGLLPPFIVRGFGIPLFVPCATFAVVRAVSSNQSGLASGTLGMVRNIGTAFGVAVLSQIYLFHINTAMPSSLATSRAAAEQFIISGQGTSRRIIESVILDGFIQTSIVCLILCGCAMVCAIFIRTRLQAKSSASII